MSADPRCYSLELKNTKEKLKLTNLGIHVVITGFLAKTAVTMTFMNDTDHDGVEGELVFPMAEGSVLSGYAIDINGELVEGVVIEKEKARQVFETEARKEVSHKPTASIAEHVVGNVFKTRVFPIPKRGPRTIRVTTVEEVDGKNTFYLLLDFASQLVDQYELSVQVDSYGPVAPKIWDGLSTTARSGRTMPALEYSAKTNKNTASTRDSSLSEPAADRIRYQERFSSSSPSSPKGCIVYLPPSENVVIVEPNETKTEHYFVVGGQFSSFASTLPPAGSDFDVINNRVGIVWDTSLSRMSHDKKVDMEVVKLIASKLGKGAKIDIIPFSDAMRSPHTITMTGNASTDHSALTNYLNTLTYDGGTNISSLNLTKGPTTEESSSITTDTYAYYCLFTDGMHNMSTKAMPKALESPVYIFASSSEANTSLLKILARKSGGEYFKLALSSSNHELKQKVDSLGKPVFSFLGVNVDSNYVREVYPSIPTRVDSVFRLSGKLVLDADSETGEGTKKTSPNTKFAGTFITLNFGFGVKVIHSITCQLKTDGASYTSLIPRFWAQRKIDELALFPEETENEKIILDLGRKFSIVTPTTSIIVLEELEQYVKHDIEPPVALQSIRTKWLAIMQERANEKKAIEEEKILSVLSLWSRRTAWWNEDIAASEAQEKNHMHCMPYGDGIDLVERTLASQWIDWDKLHEDSSDSEYSDPYPEFGEDSDMSSEMSSDLSSDSSSESENGSPAFSDYAVTPPSESEHDEDSLFAELEETMNIAPKKPLTKKTFDSGIWKGGKDKSDAALSPRGSGMEKAKRIVQEEARNVISTALDVFTQTESVKLEDEEKSKKKSRKKKSFAVEEVEKKKEVASISDHSSLASGSDLFSSFAKSFSLQRSSSRSDESLVELSAKVEKSKKWDARRAIVEVKEDVKEPMKERKMRRSSISREEDSGPVVPLPPPVVKPIERLSMPPPPPPATMPVPPPAAPSAVLGGLHDLAYFSSASMVDTRSPSNMPNMLDLGYPQSSMAPAPMQYAQPMMQAAPPSLFGMAPPSAYASSSSLSLQQAPIGAMASSLQSGVFGALPPPPLAAGPAPPPAAPSPMAAPASAAPAPMPRRAASIAQPKMAASASRSAPSAPSVPSIPAPLAPATNTSSSSLVSNLMGSLRSKKYEAPKPAPAAPAPAVDLLMRRSSIADESSDEDEDDAWDGDVAVSSVHAAQERLEEAEPEESGGLDLFGDCGEAEEEEAPMKESSYGFSLNADEAPLESLMSTSLSNFSQSYALSDSPVSASFAESRSMSPPRDEPAPERKEKSKRVSDVSSRRPLASRARAEGSSRASILEPPQRSQQPQAPQQHMPQLQQQQQQPATTLLSSLDAKQALSKISTGFGSGLVQAAAPQSRLSGFGARDDKPAKDTFNAGPSSSKGKSGASAGRGGATVVGGFGSSASASSTRGGSASTASTRGGAMPGPRRFGFGSRADQKPAPKPDYTTKFSFDFDSGQNATEAEAGEASYNAPSEPEPTPYQLAQRAQEAQMNQEIEEMERAIAARRTSHAAQRYQQSFKPSVALAAWDSLGSANLTPYNAPKVSLQYAYYQEIDPNAPVEYSKDLTPAPEFPPVDWSTINYGQTPASQSWKRWRERHPEQSWSEYEGKAFSKGETFMDLFNRNRRIFLQARIQADFEAIETDNRKNRRLRPTEKPHVKYRTVLSKDTVPSDESWQLELELHTSSKSAYDQYLKMRVRPELAKLTKFYMDAADYFFEKLRDTHKAATILSNLAELELENPQFLRLIAFRLERAPEDPYLQVAINIYRKVLAIRSEEPQSHRDLAMALTRRALFLVRSLEEKKNSPSSDGTAGASIGHSAKKAMMLMSRPAFDRYALIEERKVQAEIRSLLEESVKLLNAVVIKKWDVRFNQVEVVALMDLNRVVAIIKSLNLEHTMGLAHLVDPRVISLQMPVDIRIQIQWDTDMTDVELTVTEPSGEKCNSIHNKTKSGGMMSRDFTHGYGPVEYLTRYAGDGHYSASIKLFHALEMKSGTTVLVRIWTDYGKPASEREHFYIGRLNKAKQTLQVADISVRNGVAVTKA